MPTTDISAKINYEKTLVLYPYVGIIQIRLRVWEPYPTLSQLLPAPLFQFFTIIVRFCLVFKLFLFSNFFLAFPLRFYPFQ